MENDNVDRKLEEILNRHNIRTIEDLEAKVDADVFEELYDYWGPVMPYGTAKARSGDPHEFIFRATSDYLDVRF